jgi:anaerobic C4-dicarboxylate transporter
MLNVLTVTWASVTVILVGLLIYRALIGMREEDQLFLASGEEHLARDQQVLQARISSVNKLAVWLGILSGLLLVCLATIWIYNNIGLR